MHSVIDSEKASFLAAEENRRKRATVERLGAIEKLKKSSIYESGLGESPLSWARQSGRTMSSQELDKLLAGLLPTGYKVELSPKDPSKKVIWRIMPDGSRHYLTAFESGLSPEFSITTAHEEWVADPDYCGEGAKVIERADVRGERPVSQQEAWDLLQKYGLEGAVEELKKRPLPESRPGFKKILVEGAEAIRGWRTLLARLVQLHICTPDQVERAVWQSDRETWAAQMGRSGAQSRY